MFFHYKSVFEYLCITDAQHNVPVFSGRLAVLVCRVISPRFMYEVFAGVIEFIAASARTKFADSIITVIRRFRMNYLAAFYTRFSQSAFFDASAFNAEVFKPVRPNPPLSLTYRASGKVLGILRCLFNFRGVVHAAIIPHID